MTDTMHIINITKAFIQTSLLIVIFTQEAVHGSTGSAVTGSSVTTTRYVPDNMPSPWDKRHIPNPRRDVWRCGRHGKRSWVCDPEGILTPEQADRIDKEIDNLRKIGHGSCKCKDTTDCRRTPEILSFRRNKASPERNIDSVYGGWQAGVAIVNKIKILTHHGMEEKEEDLERYIYAKHVRRNTWSLGVCDDDLLVLVAVDHDWVDVSVGEGLDKVLPTHCVEMIKDQTRHYFKSADYANGIWSLISGFRGIIGGTIECTEPVNYTAYLVIAGIAVFILIIVIFLRRQIRNKACMQNNTILMALLNIQPNDTYGSDTHRQMESVSKGEGSELTELTAVRVNLKNEYKDDSGKSEI